MTTVSQNLMIYSNKNEKAGSLSLKLLCEIVYYSVMFLVMTSTASC